MEEEEEEEDLPHGKVKFGKKILPEELEKEPEKQFGKQDFG